MPTKAKEGWQVGRWRKNQGRINKDPLSFSRRMGSPGAYLLKKRTNTQALLFFKGERVVHVLLFSRRAGSPGAPRFKRRTGSPGAP